MSISKMAILVLLCCFNAASALPSQSVSKVMYTLVGKIPLKVGQAPPDFGNPSDDTQTPPGCIRSQAKSVARKSNENPYNDLDILSIKLADGREIVGTSYGHIFIRSAYQPQLSLNMPPSPTSIYKRGREGTAAHIGSIHQMILMPDQHNLISLANDNALRVWNIETGKMVGLHISAQQACVTKDNLTVLRLKNPDRFELWNLPENQRIWQAPSLRGGGQPMRQFTGDTIQTAAQVFRIKDGEELGYRRSGQNIIFSPNNKLLALSSKWVALGYSSKIINLVAEVFDSRGKQLDEIYLPETKSGSFSSTISLAFSPDSQYITLNQMDYSRLIIETPLELSKDINYSLNKKIFMTNWENTKCTTRNNFSDLNAGQLGRDVRTTFDGSQILYYTSNPKLSATRPKITPNITYGMDVEARYSDATIFSIDGYASTYDYTTGNFFRILDNCDIFNTENRKPSLIIQWPKTMRERIREKKPFASSKFIAITGNQETGNPDTYIFSAKTGKYLTKLVDFTPSGFLTPEILLKDDLTAVNLNHPSKALPRSVEGISAGEQFYAGVLSPDHTYVAVPRDDQINIYKITLVK